MKNIKNKILYVAALLTLGATQLRAQINVGSASAPDPSAMLQVTSTTKGFLPPRVSLTGANGATGLAGFSSAATGLVVYNTGATRAAGYYYYNGSSWLAFTTGYTTAPVSSGAAWSTTGNSGTVAGTNFLGTTDNQDIVFKRGGVLTGFLGLNNIGFGTNTLVNLSGGINNYAMGHNALQYVTTGSSNIAMGRNTLNALTTGSFNIAIGNGSAGGLNGDSNTIFGHNTGQNISGKCNSLFGLATGNSLTSGSYNTYVGNSAGRNGSGVGNYNTGVGNDALGSVTSGVGNSAMGTVSMGLNTSGSGNSALGAGSLQNNTTGSYNVAVGDSAGYASITGNSNTFLGYWANTTADGFTNATAIGARAVVGASNSMVLGSIAGQNNASVSANVGIGLVAPAYTLDVVGDINASGNIRSGGSVITSDVRLKRNIRASAYGLGTVLAMQPVQYQKKSSIAGNDYNRNEIGFIAQDIQKLMPSIVEAGKDADRTLAVNYTEIIPVLTKAIQEQQAEIDLLTAKQDKLRLQAAKVQVQTTELDAIKAAIAAIRAQLNKAANKQQ